MRDFRVFHSTLTGFLVLLLATPAYSQQSDTLAVDDADSAHFSFFRYTQRSDFQIFGEVSRIHIPSPTGYVFNTFYSGGVSYQNWHLGTFISFFDGNYVVPVIFPNDAILRNLYGGGFLGYRVFAYKQHQAFVRLYIGGGEMLWEDEQNFFNYFADKYGFLMPEIRYEFKLFHLVDIFGAMGYRQLYSLDLPYVSKNDFQGFSAGVGIKLVLSKRVKSED